MARQRFTPEQIIGKLPEVEVLVSCMQNLPYNPDALREVADIAPLNNTQYKAVQKALQSKLA